MNTFSLNHPGALRSGLILFSLIVLLPAGCSPASEDTGEIATRFTAVERVVAIGDLHGDLDATRRAAERVPNVGGVQVQLGLLLFCTGQTAEAARTWQALLTRENRAVTAWKKLTSRCPYSVLMEEIPF